MGEKQWLFYLIVLKLMMVGVLLVYFYLTNRKSEKLTTGYKSVIKILVLVSVFDSLAYLGTTWGYSITTNTTSLITVIANAFSVPTIFLAYIILKERVTKQQKVGIATIIIGIIVSSL